MEDVIPLEEEEDFIEHYNTVATHFPLPGKFVDEIRKPIYREPDAANNPAYKDMGTYFLPNPPPKVDELMTQQAVVDDISNVPDAAASSTTPADFSASSGLARTHQHLLERVAIDRRVYAFTSLYSAAGHQKIFFIKAREANARFFLASNEFESIQALVEFYHGEKSRYAYPEGNFDAKWVLIRMMNKMKKEEQRQPPPPPHSGEH